MGKYIWILLFTLFAGLSITMFYQWSILEPVGDIATCHGKLLDDLRCNQMVSMRTEYNVTVFLAFFGLISSLFCGAILTSYRRKEIK